jgi:hypothetical protein
MGTYQGDLGKTKIIESLCETQKDLRDDNWRNRFCREVVDASFACGEPQVLRGPDGFPYFQLELPQPYKEFQCYVIRHMKDDFLLNEGWGVVINAGKKEPDWVFSHGDIVNLHIAKEFYTASDNWNLPSKEVIEEDEEVLIAQPSEAFLPAVTRTILRNFLVEAGVNDGKLLLMGRHRPQGISQELVFNMTPEKFAKKEQFEAIMRRISWFLPRHYRYVSMPESSMENNFELI